jgi:uncharacterized protein YbaR (Trm112 family)
MSDSVTTGTNTMSIDREALDILRCPVTGQRLHAAGENEVLTGGGKYRYPVIDGIFVLLQGKDKGDWSEECSSSMKNSLGTHHHLEGTTIRHSSYVPQAPLVIIPNDAILRSTHFCRLKENIYWMPLRSNPAPGIYNVHEKFYRRVCEDFSLAALLHARKKLGNKGIYVLADLTRLPLAVAPWMGPCVATHSTMYRQINRNKLSRR